MSDESTDNQDPAEDLSALRNAAKKGAAALDENALLKREMAFMRAGIDTSSKPAQALLRSYQGELEPDAIKAEAAEWGLGASTAPAAEPADEPAKLYDESTPERQAQAIRDKAQGAPAPAPEAPAQTGVEAAFAQFLEDRESGMTMTQATNRAYGNVIKAAAMGDASARFDQQAWEREREQHGHGAEFAR